MHVPLVVHPGCKEVTEAYPTQNLGPNMVGDRVDYFTAILSRINVHAKRSFAEWHVDDLDDGISDGSNIRVRRLSGSKSLLNLIS